MGSHKRRIASELYTQQKSNSSVRGMELPSYSREEWVAWVIDQPIYHKLYKAWLKSGCISKLKPSGDRLEDRRPYSFDNVRICTWGENKLKGETKRYRAVLQLGKYTNEVIASYPSIAEACRVTGAKAIVDVCKGNQPSSGGFKWEYVL